ncbi:MAG: Ig-like domain-containing protein [Chitinophagales bacterium]
MRYLFLLPLLLAVFQSYGNTPPALRDDTLYVCKNSTGSSINIFANDIDADGDSLFVADTLISAAHGTFALINGQLNYVPDANFQGSDKLYFQICDNGTPSLCAYSFVVISVDTCYPVDNAPVATFDSLGACRNQTNELLVLNNDTDSDGDSLYVQAMWYHPVNGSDSLAGGRLFYKPNLGFTGIDSLQYVVCDVPATVAAKCDTERVLITVINCGGTNHAPTAQIDIVPGLEDAPFSLPFDPRSNDTDQDGDSLTWTALLGPFNGTVTPLLGRWTYKPNPNFNGIDLMPYRVCDNGTPQRCAFSVVTFIIAGVNDAPVIRPDEYTVLEDMTDTFLVTRNDTDVDGDFIRVDLFSLPTHGRATVINRNRVIYTPDPNFYGEDGFDYEGCDSSVCKRAHVTIHVLPVNDSPVANPDTAFRTDDVVAWVRPLYNDTDIDGDTLILTAVDSGRCFYGEIQNGQLIIRTTPAYTTSCEEDTLHYTTCDAGGLCASSFIIVYNTSSRQGEVILPQGFSPNGDGVNDRLVFEGLEKYYPALLQVYNRYGYEVYNNDDYRNDWDGTTGSHHLHLPDGAYWYIIQLNSGKRFINYCELQR